jgi:hypothetical protein
MRAAVEAASDFECEPDAETPAAKNAVTLNYKEMLAAQDRLLAEMRQEGPAADEAGKVVYAQPSKEPTTAQPNVWLEAHAALSQK